MALGIQGKAYYFNLVVGELYAIKQHDTGPQHGGTFIGTVDVGSGPAWLAFENSNDQVKFYNPAHIKVLMPESDPRRLA